MERMDYTALSKTYNIDMQIPDSAATATALLCGHKAKFMTAGLPGDAVFGDCEGVSQHYIDLMASDESDSSKTSSESILIKSAKSGKATGLVTTTRLTHATPSAAYAHTANRWWEMYAPAPCVSIAEQFIAKSHFFNVTFAGGAKLGRK